MLSVPHPPLADRELSLWPWHADDALELARAWADPEIAARNDVPSDRSEAAARRWIGGDAQRLRDDLSLDLAIVERDMVAGEVGLSEFRGDKEAALIGYWVHAEFRGKGVATRAVKLLTQWALTPGSLRPSGLDLIVARCAPDNLASQHVALAAGYELARPDHAGNLLYICRRPEVVPGEIL